MSAEDIKSETTEELKDQLSHLYEREQYFRWKMGIAPWCNNPDTVKRYSDLVAECGNEIELIELELKERGEL